MARPTRLPVDPNAPVTLTAAKAAGRPVEMGLETPGRDPLGAVGPPSAANRAAPEGVGLAQFLLGVGDTLRQFHGRPQWIRCEVAFVQAKAKGYWVLGLQETDGQGRKLAAAEALVWSQDADRVLGLFERATGEPLAAGMQILLRVELSFSPEWGLRLLGKGIDPRWTVGEAEQARQRLRRALEAEGLWELQRRLPAPADFTRVAVVAPEGSAGVEDFLREADRLAAHGLCAFEVFHAPFEGDNAPRLLPDALVRAGAAAVDAVVVVRGGGAASGIAWLNHEAIVRAAAALPVPLITGIGHERDRTLLDDLAHTACGTPSKAAGHLVQAIVERARRAEQTWEHLGSVARARLDRADAQVDQVRTAVVHQALGRLDQQATHVDGLWRESVGMGPSATLERGYALVSNAAGKLIRRAADVPAHAPLTLRFADGTATVSPSPPEPLP